jgi:hypothetical protein
MSNRHIRKKVKLCLNRGERAPGPGLRHLVRLGDETIGLAWSNRLFQLLSST